jgi:F-type H+-transporting ATPase subunit b
MKSWSARFFRVWSLCLILFLTVLPALAQQAAEENPSESTTGLVFRWLNFFLVFGGAGFLIAKYGANFFRSNARAIAAKITEASAARAEAEHELRETEAKIARLDLDVANLREQARRESAAEAERLRKAGVAEVEKIFQAAQVEQAAAERAAMQQLRELAASMAVDQAGALVNARMNGETRGRLFRRFLGELGRGAN